MNVFDANKKNTKLYSDIIKQFYYSKTMSCADLSLRIDKSIPLVTKAINFLMEKGFVLEKGLAESTGGRRPLMYTLKEDQINIVAVAMDQLSTRIVILDVNNKHATAIEVVDLKLRNNPNSLTELTKLIDRHIKRSGIKRDQIFGVGIGMPGFVDSKEGINYTYLKPRDKSLSEYIADELQLPVFIDNDSSLVALAEQKFGLASTISNAMVVNVSWGIGLGMIINGELFRGHNGFAGEFSHIPISESGLLCSCGKQGCLEAEASLLAVTEKAIVGIAGGRISSLVYTEGQSIVEVGEALLEAAVNGDQFAIEMLSDAAYKIGRGLSILIHIMNPKAIILSGRGVKVGKLLLAPIQQALNQYCIPRLAAEMQLLISDIGFDAELVGAAVLVMENFGEDENVSWNFKANT